MMSLQADAEAGGATFFFGGEVVSGDMSSFAKQLSVKDTKTNEIHTIQPECIVNSAGSGKVYHLRYAPKFQLSKL